MAQIPACGIALIFTFLLSSTIVDSLNSPSKIFNVRSYGARADGRTDDSKAFLRAWNDSCQWSKGDSRVLIPQGAYMLHSLTFIGPCKKPVWFVIEGKLNAPTSPSLFNSDTWIGFRYIDRLNLEGGGVLDGQGPSAWKYNDCAKNPLCKRLPVTLRLDFITNSNLQNIQSINSKNSHINLFACENVNISSVGLTAPGDSPNTDGIHIGNSTNVKISKVNIGTGDDCISMVAGSRNIEISEVHCGPGHGISIGSLGKYFSDEHVKGVSVFNSNFSNTQNGVRIKTWSPSFSSLASDIVFQDLRMENVSNPIFIDQQYCPSCGPMVGKSISLVQINNVTYSNIQGTSTSKVAVSLQCSMVAPCKRVKLVDINLKYNGPGGPATASCSNVLGTAYGKQTPPGCL